MLTKGMIMIIIGVSGLIITLGIGFYTSRKFKQQLENVESATSNLSLSEQLTIRKETKTIAKSKKHEQSNDSIPLQPLPELYLENEENPVNSNGSSDEQDSITSAMPAHEMRPLRETVIMSNGNIDTTGIHHGQHAQNQAQTPKVEIVADTTIMNVDNVVETRILQQPKGMIEVKPTTVLKTAEQTALLEKDDENSTQVLSQNMK